MKTRVKVGREADFPEGEVRCVRCNGDRVAIARVAGRLYAFEDRCTHDDGPLGEGELEGFQVICPRHGARFDVRDGSVVAMPAVFPITTYPVEVKDGEVEVLLEDQ
ncbi:MAG TPA: non-heme iron oxygenase ferredoxin subunit [Candidatus Nitrosotenuis sp.]|jgi:3-phenylpropionate/trans-cinnamate dioxygenase ferredoxin subunit|nr:non-heme iron oxygenase ferredoxin subunit [Candidatus Nitrosotenuis sp.]